MPSGYNGHAHEAEKGSAALTGVNVLALSIDQQARLCSPLLSRM